jgi:dihydroxyacid dehydratase/phosphogluconate dehydratase
MAIEQGPAPIDRTRLRSQRLREVNFQGDALRLGMNWTEDDLRKPQVLVESSYGMGHPGTFHFRDLIDEVSNGVCGRHRHRVDVRSDAMRSATGVTIAAVAVLVTGSS